MILRVKKLAEVKIPNYAHGTDAGLDLYAPEDFVIKPSEVKSIGCKLSIELPPGTFGLVQGKSGHAVKYGITTIGNVIDEGYSGEIHVIIANLTDNRIVVEKDMKIAQLLILPIHHVEVQEADEIRSGERGDGGLGSTGI